MGLFNKQKKEEPTEGNDRKSGSFLGFALLSDAAWDKARFIRDLKNDWDIDASDSGSDDGAMAFTVDGIWATIGFMPAPVPNGEAEECAANNYMWHEAAETAKLHKAHLVVAALGREQDPVKTGELFVKLMASCCKQENILGVYRGGTVYEPRFYLEVANVMKEGELPIPDLVWFGLCKGKRGLCGYTSGMEQFGKPEMEVVNANAKPSDLQGFLMNIASYVVESDVTLKDGETIGFSADDKRAITYSKGVALPGMTLKIKY